MKTKPRGRVKRRREPPQFLPPLTPWNVPVRRCPVPRDEASHRILIMRAGAIGDVLMGTPLLAALRDAYPHAHLTWIAESTEAEAIDANPYLDEYVRWDSPYWKKMLRQGLYPLWLLRVLRMRKTLRDKNYDVFISFQPEEWPLLLRGVRASVSVGIFDTFKRFYGRPRNPRYRRLYTHAYGDEQLPPHRIDQYLLTLEALGLPQVPPPPMSMGYTQEDGDAAERFLISQGIEPGQPFVALAPMTTWPTPLLARRALCGSRRMPWLTAEIGLRRRPHRQRAPRGTGGRCRSWPPDMEDAADPSRRGDLTFSADGGFDRPGSAALVSGDTGPMHVACALNTPQVALFGPTSPEWYGPRGGRALTLLHPVPCGPCDQKFCPNPPETHLRCMKLLSLEDVLQAVERMLTPVGVA